MSGVEAVSEALSAWASREIDDPEELNRAGSDFTILLEDVAYAAQRKAERIEQTGLHGSVAERFHQSAARARHNASITDELLNFPIVTTRR